MKYSFIFLFISIVALQSCGGNKQEAVTNQPVNDSAAFKNIHNVYKGDFGEDPIYITLNFFNGKHLGGYNVHKGLRRNISGELKQVNNNWEVILSEPGDHPYDGVFKITFNHDFSTAEGVWTANNKSYAVKNFNLQKLYSTSDYSEAYKQPTLDFLFMDYDSSKSEFGFSQDGTCDAKLYLHETDSTFAQQLVSLKGSYKKINDSTFIVTWQKNTVFSTPTSSFIMEMAENDENSYPIGLRGEGFHFSPVF